MKNYDNISMTAAEREKLSKIDVGIKSNLNAPAAPTVTDDSKAGYSIGSTWKYNSLTYICGDATEGKAIWSETKDVSYFNTWAELVAAISVAGTQYVGKYSTIANANGAPSGGVTYTAPAVLTDYIVDGGGAILKVNAQGTNYSVTCQPRTITNPIITSVMVVAAAKPTTKGYYIFTVTPTGGLPSGISLNDIAYYDGTAWSLYQLYVKASTVLVATNQTGTTQVTWRKFAGTWMSTADEFIPDGKEYQTSKLWNGKPVYRKCKSGTTQSSLENTTTGMTIPTTGTMLLCLGSLTRSDNAKFTCGYSNSLQFLYSVDLGSVTIWTNVADFKNRPYVVWIEYTKS